MTVCRLLLFAMATVHREMKYAFSPVRPMTQVFGFCSKRRDIRKQGLGGLRHPRDHRHANWMHPSAF